MGGVVSTIAMAPQLSRRQPPQWLLAGRYRMEEVIGRGGMSTVYRATDTVLGRDVAVKVLLAALAQQDPSHVARFQREARAVAALRHPAVVKVYDTGTDRGAHYIVMEHVPGRGLDEVIAQGRLGVGEAARIAARVAEAVAAAHAAGILHRDIKPANVMLAPEGAVKVLDFGIARTLPEATITQRPFAIGTAAYMPPERVVGRPGDERSDVYALGCLLYALLTGRPPFLAEEPLAILHQHVHATPSPLGQAGARVPPGLENLVLAMLAKNPDDRPQTAAEVAGLLAAASGSPARPAPPPPAKPGRRSSSTRAPRPARWRGRRLPAALLTAAAAALVLALVALGSGSRGPASAARRTATARTGTHRLTQAAPRSSAGPATARAPAGGTLQMGANQPAAPPAGPLTTKKHKPVKGHKPPGHGGVPPGQVGKPPKHHGPPPG